MTESRSITMPNVNKLNLEGVNVLVRKFSEISKAKDRDLIKGAAIAVAFMMAQNGNLSLKELYQLVREFNHSCPRKDAIKRYLILEAMFFAKHIKQIVINNKRRYNKAPAMFVFELAVRPKRIVENEVSLEGDIRRGYFSVKKVIGEMTVYHYFGQYKANKLEKLKIMEVEDIKKIQVKKEPTGKRCLYISTNQNSIQGRKQW